MGLLVNWVAHLHPFRVSASQRASVQPGLSQNFHRVFAPGISGVVHITVGHDGMVHWNLVHCPANLIRRDIDCPGYVPLFIGLWCAYIDNRR